MATNNLKMYPTGQTDPTLTRRNKAICGAKRLDGEAVCKRVPRTATGRCFRHSGAGVGPAHGGWKHGRYSLLLPKGGFTERYQQSYIAPDILSMAPEIAVVDARIGELLGRLSTGETGRLWDQLQAAFGNIQSANRRSSQARQREEAAKKSGDATALKVAQADLNAALREYAQAMGKVESLIAAGGAERDTWSEISEHFEQRRKLVESEQKRLLSQQLYMTYNEADLLFKAVIGAVADVVKDRPQLSDIMRKLRAIVTSSSTAAKPREFLTDGVTVDAEPVES